MRKVKQNKTKTNGEADNRLVVPSGKEGWRRVKWIKGVIFMVMDGN